MLTSESKAQEFHDFVMRNTFVLQDRLKGTVYNKYRRAIIYATQKDEDIPPVIAKIKVGDINFYASAFGVRFRGPGFEVKAYGNFLTMKDLRKQTNIMVVETDDSVILFNTHAISRYKERIGLTVDMNFEDVCKHMITVGCCGSTKTIMAQGQIHDNNVHHMEVRIICLNGAFIGYYSEETGVIYAETFLSENEIRDNQAFLDVNRDPAWKKWKENQELILRGRLDCRKAEEPFAPGTALALENGNIRVLSDSEVAQRKEEYAKIREEIPDMDQQQIQQNRIRKDNRLRRKGIK